MNEQTKINAENIHPAAQQGLAVAAEVEDAELAQALASFKASVHAWSDAAYTRPRTTPVAARRTWRLAAGWALGCVLVAGGVSGGLLEHHHTQQLARLAAEQHAAEQQKRLRAQQAAAVPDDDLLAGVDSDVSRQVPSALEPMAQMMQDDGTK